MKSLADGFPPEIAARINPRWRENEQAYWAVRDSLLADFGGRWILFAAGKVIAAGTSPVEVFHSPRPPGELPYFAQVGAEEEPCRMRRTRFDYDATFSGEPMPTMDVEFRAVSGTPGPVFDRVIADTGADASALPWADCEAIGLELTMGVPGRVLGVGNTAVLILAFQVWAFLDGVERTCRLQAEFSGPERILGRDVLNQVDVLFRGPARETIVNP